jgi:hypothetical protein
LWLAVVSLLFAWAGEAQPLPVLANSEPVYLMQGTTREVALQGQNLAAAQSLMITEARGLTATLVPGSTRVKLLASPDAALGDRQVRVVTPTGISAPLKVTVGQFPLIEETSPNESIETAQAVELPAEIAGHIGFPGDADFFQFVARRGEHLIFDVHALRAGSPLEAVLSIHTISGRELPRKIEYHAGDPMLVFDVPSDGSYVLQIHDLQYRGAANYAYRIESGAIPYIESLLPTSGQPGQRLELRATGHNLKGAERIQLDLTGAAIGIRTVQTRTAVGWSNEVPFLVTDDPPAQIRRTIGPTTQPMAVAVPSDVSGLLGKRGQEDAYTFHLAARRQVTLAVTARETGSLLDALLTLKSAGGAVIEQANPGDDADAKISRLLEAGDYTVTLRDLTNAGGESYSYRLSFSNGGIMPDFSVRVLPDAARVARAGHAKLWCDVARFNGLGGPVMLGIDGLPPGVSAGRVMLEDPTSGVFTISAASDAPLGTFPLQIKAMSVNGIVRNSEPVFLTVLPAAPIGVQSIASFKVDQRPEIDAQMTALSAKLKAPNPKVDADQAAWEKQIAQANPIVWTALDFQSMKSLNGATLTRQPDGSILSSGTAPDKDTYSIAASTELKGITAIRLEALTDPSLPGNGPGRAQDGNLVLTHLVVTAGPISDPKAAKPIAFKSAVATFEQANFPVASAAGLGAGGGWALHPQLGKNQTATFVLAAPLDFSGGTALTFAMEQTYGASLIFGKFRFTVTTDARAGVMTENAQTVLPEILALVRTPADKRTAEQKATLAAYYRQIAPEFAADYAKLDSLRRGVGVYAEIAQLTETLSAATPPLNTPTLDAVRQRLDGLKARATSMPLTVARNKDLSLPVPITRDAGFTAQVQVSLEGFSSGRDPATRMESPIARNLVVSPFTIGGVDCFGTLNIRPTATCELGTRMVVLRAETKVGPDTYVVYSDAFPLTVTEK